MNNNKDVVNDEWQINEIQRHFPYTIKPINLLSIHTLFVN